MDKRTQYSGPAIITLVTVSLAFFVASLFLPVIYGAEISGLTPGFLLLVIGFAFPSPLTLMSLSYVCTPLSLVAATWSYRFAAWLAGFGLIFPIALLCFWGLYIDVFLGKRRDVLNSGGLCAFGSATLMLVAWMLAGKRGKVIETRTVDGKTT